MNRKYTLLALLTICSGGTFAQTTSIPPKFVDVDRDNDGEISQSELEIAGLNIILANADTDQNGTLTLTEYEAGLKNSTPSDSSISNTKDDDKTDSD